MCAHLRPAHKFWSSFWNVNYADHYGKHDGTDGYADDKDITKRTLRADVKRIRECFTITTQIVQIHIDLLLKYILQ